jgi:hypothetical protein
MELVFSKPNLHTSWKTTDSFSPFLGLRKVKGVHLSDTQKLQLRSELEPVPLDSGLANPSIEWQGANNTLQHTPNNCVHQLNRQNVHKHYSILRQHSVETEASKNAGKLQARC